MLARYGGRAVFQAVVFIVVGVFFPAVLTWIVTPPDVHWAVGPGIFVMACLMTLPFIAKSLLLLKSVVAEGGRAVWIEGDTLVFTGESQITRRRLMRGEIAEVIYREEYGYERADEKPTVRITTTAGKVWIISLWDVVKTVDALSEAIEGWRAGAAGR